eukprot:scaffold128704_cov63-Phaeocystis_antarctica.AAC.3
MDGMSNPNPNQRARHLGVQVGFLLEVDRDEVVEALEAAVLSRSHERQHAQASGRRRVARAMRRRGLSSGLLERVWWGRGAPSRPRAGPGVECRRGAPGLRTWTARPAPRGCGLSRGRRSPPRR